MCNYVSKMYDMDAFYDKLTVEFCERLRDADWSCNVSTLNDEDFEIAYTQWMRNMSKMDFAAYQHKMESRGEEE